MPHKTAQVRDFAQFSSPNLHHIGSAKDVGQCDDSITLCIHNVYAIDVVERHQS